MIVSLRVGDAAWAAIPDLETKTIRACEAAWRKAGRADLEGELSILLTGDGEVAALNARWRGRTGATNVLSFPAAEHPAPAGAPRSLGDLALAHGVIASEARAQGKSLQSHAIHLVVHGCLHLLGHDHEMDGEAQAMESLETEILAGLGIADPYRGDHERH